MLFNSQNQRVKVNPKLNSTTSPRIFRDLREVLEPEEPYAGTMFQLEQRTKITDIRQNDDVQ